MLVGTQHCDCMRTHRTHTCRVCGDTTYTPVLGRPVVGTSSTSARKAHEVTSFVCPLCAAGTTTLTHSLDEVAAIIPCTRSWLADGLRAGRFPGRKIAKQWRHTHDDIEAIIKISMPKPKPAAAAVSIADGLNPAVRRRIERRLGLLNDKSP